VPFLDHDHEACNVFYATDILGSLDAGVPASRPQVRALPDRAGRDEVLCLVFQQRRKARHRRVCGRTKALNVLTLAYGDRITHRRISTTPQA